MSVVRESGAPSGLPTAFAGKVREIVRYRELLANLVRKELKVRYKNSALGFMWSLVSPLLYLGVFYVVFNVFLPGGIPKYHVYLLAGLLPWTLFSSGLFQATGAAVGNADLIKKVYFPRELLPLSAIGAALVHFFLQFLVLAAFLLITRYPFSGVPATLLPLALGAELIFIAGLGLVFAAVNVRARDIQHFLELALLAWFWMTPIVYPSALVAKQMAQHSIAGISFLTLYLANPMIRITLAFQRGIYGTINPDFNGQPVQVLIDAPLSWYFGGVGYTAIVGVVFLVIGWMVFHRLEADFAEDL